MEQQSSSGSVTSSRRSVSSMKQLLSLKLQPTPPLPKVDLSSWLDETVPPLQPPIAFDFDFNETNKSRQSNNVPWNWSSEELRLSNDLHPTRYRETPIYSEPGSPMPTRAYFPDENSYRQCPDSDSVCDELCILSDYEDAETPDSGSQVSFLDCAETFDNMCNASAETSPTSFASSRISELSIKCQGEYGISKKSSRLKINVEHCPTNDNIWDDTRESAERESDLNKSALAECWLGSDSSRSSSPAASNEGDELYDVR